MCRLFGLHSKTKARVHRSLVAADNALKIQSKTHTDGWGLAYYLQGHPHVIKSLHSASDDQIFAQLAKSLNAQTVLAHVRQATQGEISLVNCHPFQYGRWTMAHNGTCPAFGQIREELVRLLPEPLKFNIFGTTDSEVYFALIINELASRQLLEEQKPSLSEVAASVGKAVERIENIYRQRKLSQEPSLNLLLTNGHFLLGLCLGRSLYYHHQDGQMQICSEPLGGDLEWLGLAERQMVAADHDLRMYVGSV